MTDLLKLFLFLAIMTIGDCTEIYQKNKNLSKEKTLVNLEDIEITSNVRLLTTASQPFKINYVIQTYLKNYDSRVSFCRYLCQSDSLLSLFSVLSCYQSYNCNSLILQNIFTILCILCYCILPFIMIVFGVWNFRCLGDNIAILTGVVCINSIYSKVSRQFNEDMQTDYDISVSQGSEEVKGQQRGSDIQQQQGRES